MWDCSFIVAQQCDGKKLFKYLVNQMAAVKNDPDDEIVDIWEYFFVFL